MTVMCTSRCACGTSNHSLAPQSFHAVPPLCFAHPLPSCTHAFQIFYPNDRIGFSKPVKNNPYAFVCPNLPHELSK